MEVWVLHVMSEWSPPQCKWVRKEGWTEISTTLISCHMLFLLLTQHWEEYSCWGLSSAWLIHIPYFIICYLFKECVTGRHKSAHKHTHTDTMFNVRFPIYSMGGNKTRQIFNLDREQDRIFSYTRDNAPFASAGLKRACREHTVRENDSSGVKISNYGYEGTETGNEKQKVRESPCEEPELSAAFFVILLLDRALRDCEENKEQWRWENERKAKRKRCIGRTVSTKQKSSTCTLSITKYKNSLFHSMFETMVFKMS